MAQTQPQPWCRTPEGLELLHEIHDDDESLSMLDLTEKGLGVEDAGELATALRTNSNVKTLYLYGNAIGDDGVAALAGVLRDNVTIIVLEVMSNGIRDRGAEALAEMVRNNGAIARLDLGGNQIEDGGAGALAMALIRNSTLEEVYLGPNSIGDGGAGALASAVCLSPALTDLNLQRNRIGERGTRALKTAMRNLGGEGVGEEDVAAFVEGLFAETSPIQLGSEELGAIEQHLATGNAGEGNAGEEEFTLVSDLEGVPTRAKRAGQQNLMRAVVGYGMVRAAVSQTEDHAVLMIVEKAGKTNGIRNIFEIIRAKPGLFKSALSANIV